MNEWVTKTNITMENGGNKAARLALLQESGFLVPSFFCLTVAGMERCLQPLAAGLDAYLRKEPAQQSAEEISQLFATLPLVLQVEEIVAEGLAVGFSEVNRFAVRSSGLLEDGTDFSFAGQYESILRVPRSEIAAQIVKCWQSALAPAIVSLTGEKDWRRLLIGVIVQEMVEPDLSGVVFSANPQGLLNESVIIVGAASGDLVVTDQTAITTVYYHKTDAVYYCEQQEGAPLLPEPVQEELLAAADFWEQQLQRPVDLEYAVKDGQVFFLQLRPVTTVHLADVTILDNSNIVESYPGVSLPLTQSFVEEVYYQVFRGVAARCLPGQKLLAQYDATLREMVACANGRMYYKISNWYTVLKFFPGQKKIIPIWQEMMGVNQKQYSQAAEPVTWGQRLGANGKILRNLFGIPQKMAQLNQDFAAVQAVYNQRFSPDLRAGELLDLYEQIAEALLSRWDLTLLNDMYAFTFTGLLKGQIRKLDPRQGEDLSQQIISGITNIESGKPVRELMRLADVIRQTSALGEELSGLASDQEVWDYCQQRTDFTEAFLSYLEQYGDRGIAELKLESQTYRVAPLLLVQQLLQYVQAPEALAVAGEALEKPAATELPAEITTNRLQRSFIGWLRKKAVLGIQNRESSRLNRARIFGMVRSILLAVGGHMAAAGQLERAEDIHYLRLEEVFAAVREGWQPAEGFQALVERRQQEIARYERLPAYSRLVFAGPCFHKTVLDQQLAIQKKDVTAARLLGTPCATGIAEGEVLVVSDPGQPLDAAGKILVASMTDPGWVFLLVTAKGLISEKGSLLSHTAIISREIGIPAAVGVSGAMENLRTGDVVRLDGTTGEIEVIKRVSV